MKKMSTSLLVLLLTLWAAESSAQIFVNHLATGANNGSSWADAYNNLQDALDAAADGDEIWVAKGVYQAGPAGADPETTFFEVKQKTYLYGGFAGTETSLAGRDIAANETILTGDLAGNDIPGDFQNNRSDNGLHVLHVPESVSDCVIDGFTIRGGAAKLGDPATGESTIPYSGGGIVSYSGTIRNCDLWGNSGRWGGACSIAYGDVRIENCTFHDNHSFRSALMLFETDAQVVDCQFTGNFASESGGAVTSWSTFSTFRNCGFVNNEAGSNGGAVLIRLFALPDRLVTFDSCHFSGNISGNETGGGAVVMNNFAYGSQLVVSDCVFENNTANDWGGGMSINNIDNPGFDPSLDVTISGTRFVGNSASYSGALDIWNGANNHLSLRMDSCGFTGNSTGVEGEGGGLFLNGEAGTMSADLSRLTFKDNTSGKYGGGLSIARLGQIDLDVTLTDSHFEGNSTLGFGGGLSASGRGAATVERSTFYANSSADHGSAIYLKGSADTMVLNDVAIWENDGLTSIFNNGNLFMRGVTLHGNSHGLRQFHLAKMSLQNCILADEGPNYGFVGTATVTSLGGNLSDDTSMETVLTGGNGYPDLNNTDPMLDAKLVPLEGSPCVDAGNPLGIDSSALDVARNPRMQGKSIDIGAYESPFIVSAQELIVGALEFAPNPATDFLYFQLPGNVARSVEVSLFGPSGQLVKRQVLPAGQPINLEDLIPGLYWAKVVDGEQLYLGKFIRQ